MWFSDAELEELMTDESDRAERKASLSDREDVKRAICAFANDLADHRSPGVVFIGLNPDGTCANLAVTEELERTAAAFRSDGSILPIPTLSVRRTTLRGCPLLVIQVAPADAPPVRVRGVAWVKVGSTVQRASSDEERRLSERIRRTHPSFDLRPVAGATIDDLDLALFEREYLPRAVSPEVLAANDRPVAQQLSSLRMTAPDGAPTFAGILCLGRDIRRWLPGAYVQFVRIDGTAVTDSIADQKVLEGPLGALLKQLEDLLRLNVRTELVIGGPGPEQRRPDYPLEALRQLAFNAVMHRAYEGTNAPVRLYWYANRVEIQNPGGPFGNVNRENFGRPGVTDYRNPQVAEALRVLGYVQRYGWGIPAALKAMSDNHNPPPQFEVDAAHVHATLRPRQDNG